jgi:predicted RNA-binding protein
MVENGEERELLADVATIIPDGKRLRLVSLFGEEEVVEASIYRINLLDHKILLRRE